MCGIGSCGSHVHSNMYMHLYMYIYNAHAHVHCTCSYMTVIGMHELHGRMHPNYGHVTILLEVAGLLTLATP